MALMVPNYSSHQVFLPLFNLSLPQLYYSFLLLSSLLPLQFNEYFISFSITLFLKPILGPLFLHWPSSFNLPSLTFKHLNIYSADA
ncbi:hypothetical protein GGR54DRAFT_590110 [Hypoxylon sp. NC1633]|nr:hypothetical protein GGR54DRAFT_590110 [Hypoxylon sp. NC1633]